MKVKWSASPLGSPPPSPCPPPSSPCPPPPSSAVYKDWGLVITLVTMESCRGYYLHNWGLVPLIFTIHDCNLCLEGSYPHSLINLPLQGTGEASQSLHYEALSLFVKVLLML